MGYYSLIDPETGPYSSPEDIQKELDYFRSESAKRPDDDSVRDVVESLERNLAWAKAHEKDR